MRTLLRPYFLLWWLPSILWASWIYWMSAQSDLPEPTFWLPPHTDKLIHAGLYAILAAVMYPALRFGRFSRISAAWTALFLASLYGLTDEWHQSMVENRHADVWDWVADTVGACSVFILARHEEKLLPRWLRTFL